MIKQEEEDNSINKAIAIKHTGATIYWVPTRSQVLQGYFMCVTACPQRRWALLSLVDQWKVQGSENTNNMARKVIS